MIWLVYLAFLPITLIVLLVKAIYYYSTRNEKPHTKAGNEVVVCKKCGAYLITSEDMFSTHTRIACSKQDMLSLIAPVLEIMREENIKYKIIETNENIVEDIKIEYTNIINGKTLLTEIYIKDTPTGRSIIVSCDETNFEYSHKDYAYLIVKRLDYHFHR